ncbi:unnamed protein product [Cladocopium goreaui]|uniref:Uncharacterized protein n=1 Tax=Cladocopium goreaui TaxID=2562237 RepID=A0A9P1DJT1_9DINO|nr:unnamed protein product [Cladocopium goreaui]
MAAEGSHAGLTAAARQARNLAMLGKTLQRQREEKEEEEFFFMVRCRKSAPCVPELQASRSALCVPEVPTEGRPCRVDSDAAKRLVRHHARGSAPLEVEGLPMAIQRHFGALGLPFDAKEPEVRLAYKRMVQAHETSDAPDGKRLKLATQAHDAICEHLGQQPWSRMPPPQTWGSVRSESPSEAEKRERQKDMVSSATKI